MDMVFSCRKNAFFQAPIKLAQPFPAPELRAENFTDTRIFLNLIHSLLTLRVRKKPKNYVTQCFCSRPILDGSNSVLVIGFLVETNFEASKALYVKTFQSLKVALTKARLLLQRGKRPPPPRFSLTKKTARFTNGKFRPYYRPKAVLLQTFLWQNAQRGVSCSKAAGGA